MQYPLVSMNYLIALPNKAKLNNMPKTNAIFDKDRPVRYELFTEGWLHGKNAWDRPVDVLFLRDGSLLLSDAR
jgi:glucose/arabinose dehydrogenase